MVCEMTSTAKAIWFLTLDIRMVSPEGKTFIQYQHHMPITHLNLHLPHDPPFPTTERGILGFLWPDFVFHIQRPLVCIHHAYSRSLIASGRHIHICCCIDAAKHRSWQNTANSIYKKWHLHRHPLPRVQSRLLSRYSLRPTTYKRSPFPKSPTTQHHLD